MRKLSTIVALCMGIFIFSACSSDDGEDPNAEYYNWKTRNDTYFEEVYQKATEKIEAGDEKWYKIMSYAKNDADNHSNYIIVNVLEQKEDGDYNAHKEVVNGTKNNNDGLMCPLVSDSCYITYRGNMIPSKTYNTVATPDNIYVGYQFDTKWFGNELIKEEAVMWGTTPGSLVEGFSTALQYMHVGDRWRVYIPYRLGYGSNANGNIQAYSTLIFDIYMESFKTKQKPEKD